MPFNLNELWTYAKLNSAKVANQAKVAKVAKVAICVFIVLVVVVCIIRFIPQNTKANFTSPNVESFFPMYEKELQLFDSMNSREQQEYLGMSRDVKLAKYGSKLI